MAKSFEELIIWQKAHALTIQLYSLTSTWPKSELFGLVSQTRRAAFSVELLISEGHSRYHHKDIIRFMIEARASASEVRNCLMLARDIKEISLIVEEFTKFDVEYTGLIKGINGFINHLRKEI